MNLIFSGLLTIESDTDFITRLGGAQEADPGFDANPTTFGDFTPVEIANQQARLTDFHAKAQRLGLISSGRVVLSDDTFYRIDSKGNRVKLTKDQAIAYFRAIDASTPIDSPMIILPFSDNARVKLADAARFYYTNEDGSIPRAGEDSTVINNAVRHYQRRWVAAHVAQPSGTTQYPSGVSLDTASIYNDTEVTRLLAFIGSINNVAEFPLDRVYAYATTTLSTANMETLLMGIRKIGIGSVPYTIINPELSDATAADLGQICRQANCPAIYGKPIGVQYAFRSLFRRDNNYRIRYDSSLQEFLNGFGK